MNLSLDAISSKYQKLLGTAYKKKNSSHNIFIDLQVNERTIREKYCTCMSDKSAFIYLYFVFLSAWLRVGVGTLATHRRVAGHARRDAGRRRPSAAQVRVARRTLRGARRPQLGRKCQGRVAKARTRHREPFGQLRGFASQNSPDLQSTTALV